MFVVVKPSFLICYGCESSITTTTTTRTGHNKK
jgi:hypothetical protein